MKKTLTILLTLFSAAAFGQLSFSNVLNVFNMDSIPTVTDSMASHHYNLYKQFPQNDADSTIRYVYVVDSLLQGAEYKNYLTVEKPKKGKIQNVSYACFSVPVGKQFFADALAYGFEGGSKTGIYHIKTMPLKLYTKFTKTTADFLFKRKDTEGK